MFPIIPHRTTTLSSNQIRALFFFISVCVLVIFDKDLADFLLQTSYFLRMYGARVREKRKTAYKTLFWLWAVLVKSIKNAMLKNKTELWWV